ncbi:MAG: S-adenosyl-l-methionine hydroxide adenosyltransferase family protein [Actinomycetota bacterium]
MPRPVVSFLSDYGHGDEFVGVCHAVMVDLVPDLTGIDITHEIPPFDVRAGALALVRAVQYLPDGVVLAVVDPGVGTDRRCIAVEVDGGFLVGPDNGVLAPAVAMLGGARRVVALTSEQHRLPAPGPTFAGRDIMAPAAAHLAAGGALGDLGPEVDPASLTPALVPLAGDEADGQLTGEVLWVDRYGNCQLNIGPEQLASAGGAPGEAVVVSIGDDSRRARWVRTYADARPGELVVVVDSYGMCALALDRRSAATELRIAVGRSVTLLTRDAGEA